jgi:hypothetical protein
MGFSDTFFYTALNYNLLQQLTTNDGLRLTPFFSSIVTDLVLIYKSVTLSRMTSHLRMNLYGYVSTLYNSRTNQIGLTISSSSSVVLMLIRCCGNVPSEPLSSKGHLCCASQTAHFQRSDVMSQYA